MVEVGTPFGKVRVKVSAHGTGTPEYEDCRAIALATAVPLRRILEAAQEAYLKTK